MKILVVDDEPVARERLERALVQIEAGHEVTQAGNAREALTRIGLERPDVVLLDIEMPGVDGLTLAALPTLPPVILVTAHADRALAAFEAGVVDYLVKPVSRARLMQALERVGARQTPAGASTTSATEPTPWRLTVVDGSLRRFVDARDVDCFHAEEKYVRFAVGGREHLVRESLDALEDRLGALGFVRAHRAALVRIDAVQAFDQAAGGTVVLRSGQQVPVSRRSLAAVRRALGLD